jgi:hypothetical protein
LLCFWTTFRKCKNANLYRNDYWCCFNGHRMSVFYKRLNHILTERKYFQTHKTVINCIMEEIIKQNKTVINRYRRTHCTNKEIYLHSIYIILTQFANCHCCCCTYYYYYYYYYCCCCCKNVTINNQI